MNGSMAFNSDRPENVAQTRQSFGKVQFTDLTHGNLFSEGRPGILHPPACMDIKWNNPVSRGSPCKLQFSQVILNENLMSIHIVKLQLKFQQAIPSSKRNFQVFPKGNIFSLQASQDKVDVWKSLMLTVPL